MKVEKPNKNRGKLTNEIVKMCLKEVKIAQTCQTEELNPLRIDQIVSKELEYIREDLQKFDLIDIIKKKTEQDFYKEKTEAIEV